MSFLTHKRNLILLLICFQSFISKSQDSTGTVQFYVLPDTLHILIDGNLKLKSTAKVKLPPGKHNILIKAKTLATTNESFMVYKDSTVYYRKIVGYNDDYKRYKSEMNKYNFYRSSLLVSSSVLVLGGYFLTYSYTKNMSDNQKESKRLAEYYAERYQLAVTESQLQEYGDKFRTHKKDYDKYRTQKYMMLPVAILSTYIAYKSFSIYKSIKKPSYLEPLSFNMGYLPGNYTNYSLTYKF